VYGELLPALGSEYEQAFAGFSELDALERAGS
jgi:hypothetical protein